MSDRAASQERPFTPADIRWLFNNYGFGSVPTDDPSLTDDRLADFVADLNTRAASQERPPIDVDDRRFREAVEYVFAAPGEFGPAKGYYGKDTDHFIDMLRARLSGSVGECKRFRHDEHCADEHWKG